MKILITGSSKGIGYQIAKDLLKGNHTLILHCNKNRKSLEKLLIKNKHESSIVQADLSTNKGVIKLFNETIAKISLPDAIINNAAIAESSDISIDFNKWNEMFEKTININLKAPALIFKEFVSYKRKNKIVKRFRVINISSRAAFRGEEEDYISYACSKGGLLSLTKTIARSFGKIDNVVSFSIAPGFVNTEMAKSFIVKHGEKHVKKGIVLDRLTKPEDISPIVSLMISGKMDHSTGSTVDVNGGSYLR
jgi:NAD(P)-dependent dehydrogenase (short-subunit alcohol dehydrogenase family)